MRDELDADEASREHAVSVSAPGLGQMTDPHTSRFAELYTTYYPEVAAYCRRRSPADMTDDLVADVFFTAWRRIDDSPGGDAVLPWLYRIAYHKTGNLWRSRRRAKQLHDRVESIGLEHENPIADQVIAREEVTEVLSAAGRLSQNDQEILRLFYWEQLTLAEIGVVLDIEPNTAKQRLHRAKRRLVAEFERSTGKRAVPLEDLDGEER